MKKSILFTLTVLLFVSCGDIGKSMNAAMELRHYFSAAGASISIVSSSTEGAYHEITFTGVPKKNRTNEAFVATSHLVAEKYREKMGAEAMKKYKFVRIVVEITSGLQYSNDIYFADIDRAGPYLEKAQQVIRLLSANDTASFINQFDTTLVPDSSLREFFPFYDKINNTYGPRSTKLEPGGYYFNDHAGNLDLSIFACAFWEMHGNSRVVFKLYLDQATKKVVNIEITPYAQDSGGQNEEK